MFRKNLLLIIRRYFSVYTAIGICHGFMLTGCWQESCWFILYGYITMQANKALNSPTIGLTNKLNDEIRETLSGLKKA